MKVKMKFCILAMLVLTVAAVWFETGEAGAFTISDDGEYAQPGKVFQEADFGCAKISRKRGVRRKNWSERPHATGDAVCGISVSYTHLTLPTTSRV